MNREKHYLLPKMQVGFIDAICHPIYKVSIQTMHGEFHKVQKLGHSTKLLCLWYNDEFVAHITYWHMCNSCLMQLLIFFFFFFEILLWMWWGILYTWDSTINFQLLFFEILLQNCNLVCFHKRKKSLYVTRSRGMSWMSGILILSYRLKEVTNSYSLQWAVSIYSFLSVLLRLVM